MTLASCAPTPPSSNPSPTSPSSPNTSTSSTSSSSSSDNNNPQSPSLRFDLTLASPLEADYAVALVTELDGYALSPSSLMSYDNGKYSYTLPSYETLDFGTDQALNYKAVVVLKDDLQTLGYSLGYPANGTFYETGDTLSFKKEEANGNQEHVISLQADFASSFRTITTDGFANSVRIGRAKLSPKNSASYVVPVGSRVTYETKTLGGLFTKVNGLDGLTGESTSGNITTFQMPDKDLPITTSFEFMNSINAEVESNFDEKNKGGKINDGVTTDKAYTTWNGDNNYTAARHIAMTYPTAQQVNEVHVFFHQENFDSYKTSLTIDVEVSEDGTTYTTDKTFDNTSSNFVLGSPNVLALSKSYNAKAIRLNFKSSSYIVLSEIATYAPADTVSEGGISYWKNADGYQVIGATTDEVVVPPQVQGTNVTSILAGSLPKTLTKLDASALPLTELPNDFLFGYEKVSEVKLPTTITKVGDFAFANNTSLKTLTGLDFTKVTSIGKSAFESVPIAFDLKLSALTTALGHKAFAYSGVKSVDFTGSTPTTISDYAFMEAGNLASVTLGGVTAIGNSAFANTTNLKGALDLTNVTSIRDAAFMASGIQEITIKAGVTIGSGAFERSGLAKVTFKGTEAEYKALQDKYQAANNEWGTRLFEGLEIVYVTN